MPGSTKRPRETVRVISDYSYKPDDYAETINLKVGDEYELIKRVNDNWWFVQKNRSSPSFYVPAKYVELVQKSVSDVETGDKSPLTTASGGKSPSVEASGKSLEPGSPAVISPMAKVPPKPKPRTTKSPSVDDALKVLDEAIDAGEKRDRKSDEGVKSTALSSISEIHPETLQGKENAKVGESAKAPSGKSSTPSSTLTLPLPSPFTGPPVSPGSSTSSVPNLSASLSSTSQISPSDEVNYVNLDEYQQMVKDCIAQTPVPGDSPFESETTDITTGDNPAESETSDYRSGDSKGGSRESIDSDSQGKSCDTDSIGTKEELDKVDQTTTPLLVPNAEDSVAKAEAVMHGKAAVNRFSRSAGSSQPDYENIENIQKFIHAQSARKSDALDGKVPVGQVAPEIEVPSGWTVEMDDGVKTFVNSATGEKWTSAVDSEGRNYFYNVTTHATVWNLNDVPTSASSTSLRRVSSGAGSSSAGAKARDRRTVATSSEIKKNSSAWSLPRALIKTGFLRMGFDRKDVKTPSGAEGAVAEVESNLVEALAEFPALEPLPIKMVQKQGQLGKAKVDHGKKSKKPSWSLSYAVLMENSLCFYKDQKMSAGAKQKAAVSLGKPELNLDLTDAQVSSSPDEKKKEILVVTLSKGDVYLLHNESEEVLQHWRQSLENNIAVVAMTPAKDVKELSIVTPTKPVETSRMSSYIGLFGEDRRKIADKLLHWLKRRPTKEVLQAKGILKDAVYGSSLKDLCDREKTKIPRFVHECIVAVEKRGLDVEGIYRVGGNMASVQKLRQIADNNEFYDLNSGDWDVHVVTGALKLFFRELSEPLFTFALFEEFLEAYKAQGRMRQVKAIRDVVRKLPTTHKETMRELFKHLTDVIRHSASNRMNPQALAIVFGPTLLWPETKNKDVTLAANLVYQGQVVEFMIVEFKTIFS